MVTRVHACPHPDTWHIIVVYRPIGHSVGCTLHTIYANRRGEHKLPVNLFWVYESHSNYVVESPHLIQLRPSSLDVLCVELYNLIMINPNTNIPCTRNEPLNHISNSIRGKALISSGNGSFKLWTTFPTRMPLEREHVCCRIRQPPVGVMPWLCYTPVEEYLEKADLISVTRARPYGHKFMCSPAQKLWQIRTQVLGAIFTITWTSLA